MQNMGSILQMRSGFVMAAAVSWQNAGIMDDVAYTDAEPFPDPYI